MGSGTGLELRRNDLRSNVLENPYWITSGSLEKGADDLDAVLFSFPITGIGFAPGYGTNLIKIHDFLFEIVTGYVGGTPVLTIGLGSIASDGVITTVTDITVDNFILNADLTLATPGWYGPTTGNTSAWLTAMVTGPSFGTAVCITPAATTVICVTGYLTSDAAISAGAGRAHMLISEVPSAR